MIYFLHKLQKKQKIEEYVKTSNRRRRKKDEGLNTSSSSVDTNPDFFVSDLNSALTSALENNTAPQEVEEEEDEEEEEMEGVEYEEIPPARPNIGKSSGKASKASSTRSTPAKKAKRVSTLEINPFSAKVDFALLGPLGNDQGYL